MPNQLLRKSNPVTYPTKIPPKELPEQFSQYFSDKISNLTEELDSRHSQPPSFVVYDGPVFDEFSLVSEDYVSDLIGQMPTKGCSLDLLPTDLVKEYADDLAPLVTSIINESLKSGVVPAHLKQAIIVPILKKSGLDFNILKNFREISNLPFLSKILEKVVLSVSFGNIYLTTSFWKLNNLPIGRTIAWRPQYLVSWTIC